MPVSNPDNKISLCMITKDEEDFLPQCLDSVRGLADEIVVVDTGSTDRTVDIARSYDAKVFNHPWEDDYSKHRNQSIAYATGNWILIMDADEVIAARDLDKIRHIINSVKTDGLELILRNYDTRLFANSTLTTNDYEEEKGLPGFIPVDLIRLFKKDPDIYFTGKVHETVSQSFGQSGKTSYKTDIPIHHYGRLRLDRIKGKQEKYLSLGKKRLKDNPHDRIAYKGLAEQYLELNMPDKALEVLNRGCAVFPDMLELRFNRGLALDRVSHYDEAKNEYLWVLERKPDHAGACHNLAQIYFFENKHKTAIEILNRVINMGLRLPTLFFLLGRAHYAVGSAEMAILNYDLALEIQPDYPNVNCHKAVVYLNMNMYGEAMNVLEREIEIGGNLVEAYKLLGQISFALKDTDSAVKFFQKVLTIDPDDPTATARLDDIRPHRHTNL